MKNNLSSDRIISATMIETARGGWMVAAKVIGCFGGLARGVSRSMNGFPDSGKPSNSLSRSWTVGNGGTSRVVANCTLMIAAGESLENNWNDGIPARIGNLGCEKVL